MLKNFVIPAEPAPVCLKPGAGIHSFNIKRAALIGTYALVGVLGLAVAAYAAEKEPETTPMDWVWRIVNFAIILGVLIYFLKKPLQTALRKRIETVEAALAEARAAREEAVKRLAEVEARLKDKDAEVQSLVRLAEENGRKEKEQLIADSAKAGESILVSAKENIDAELLKAKDALRREAALLAVELAEKIVRENIKKEDQNRIVEEYIAKVGG